MTETSVVPQLRQYQLELAARVVASLRAGKSTLAVLPTGAGKSHVAAFGVWPALGRPPVLVIVHTRTLRTQWDDYGIRAATWQSVVAGGLPADVGLVIWDEAHHTPADSYRTIRASAPAGCMHLGLTATPHRGDGSPLDRDLWDAIEEGPQVQWLQERGFLSKTRVIVGVPPDLTGVGKTGGDYSASKLAAAMLQYQSTTFGDPVLAWKDHAQERRTVAFCPTIEHAANLVARFRRAGVRADMLTGRDDDNRREDVFALFRAGRLSVVATVALLTEGWDMPNAECVHILRPTYSRVLWRQMIGRGMRPSPTSLLILDQGGCYFRHGLVEDGEQFSLDQSRASGALGDRSGVIAERRSVAGRRRVEQVDAVMIEMEKRELGMRWVYRRGPSWFVEMNRKSLGSFRSVAEAVAWRDHNIALIAIGQKPEKKLPVKAAVRINNVRRNRGRGFSVSLGAEYLGYFSSKMEAVRWRDHNIALIAIGQKPEKKLPVKAVRIASASAHRCRGFRVCIGKESLGYFTSEEEAIRWRDHATSRIAAGDGIETIRQQRRELLQHRPSRARPRVVKTEWSYTVCLRHIHLGSFDGRTQAVAWAAHNSALIAAGKPPEVKKRAR